MRDGFRLSEVRVRPLAERRTLTRADAVLAGGQGDLPRLSVDEVVAARLALQVEASTSRDRSCGRMTHASIVSSSPQSHWNCAGSRWPARLVP
jgi:hypothetical protein